jgi:hypothetical protein
MTIIQHPSSIIIQTGSRVPLLIQRHFPAISVVVAWFLWPPSDGAFATEKRHPTVASGTRLLLLLL